MSEDFLKGRVAAITGGASGMGRATALALAERGAAVAVGSLVAEEGSGPDTLAHLPPSESLERVRAELTERGADSLARNLDVTSGESVEAFLAAVEGELGPPDILVNAAGITVEQTVCGHPDPLWDRVLDVNLSGTFRMIRRCLPGMMERGWGRIVNIASTAADVGAPTSGAYCASKAGVVGLTRCVALEGAAHGVTCNAISPTWVETDFGEKWMGAIAEEQEGRAAEEYMADVREANPQGRLVQPGEVAALAVYLCREEAKGMTMQNLTLSAGSLW